MVLALLSYWNEYTSEMIVYMFRHRKQQRNDQTNQSTNPLLPVAFPGRRVRARRNRHRKGRQLQRVPDVKLTPASLTVAVKNIAR